MNLNFLQPLPKPHNYGIPVSPTIFPASFHFLRNHQPTIPCSYRDRKFVHRKTGFVRGWLLPVYPWSPNIDSQIIAPQVFAVSLFPYTGFLYFITKSKSAPKLTLFGFYFLLAFVGASTLYTMRSL